MNGLRERIRRGSGYKWWVLSLIMIGTFMAVLFIFGFGMLGGTYLLPLYMQKGQGQSLIHI